MMQRYREKGLDKKDRKTHTHTRTHSLSLSHTHTYTHTHTLTHTHTHTLFLLPVRLPLLSILQICFIDRTATSTALPMTIMTTSVCGCAWLCVCFGVQVR